MKVEKIEDETFYVNQQQIAYFCHKNFNPF